jgi:hypothetical protein
MQSGNSEQCLFCRAPSVGRSAKPYSPWRFVISDRVHNWWGPVPSSLHPAWSIPLRLHWKYFRGCRRGACSQKGLFPYKGSLKNERTLEARHSARQRVCDACCWWPSSKLQFSGKQWLALKLHVFSQPWATKRRIMWGLLRFVVSLHGG